MSRTNIAHDELSVSGNIKRMSERAGPNHAITQVMRSLASFTGLKRKRNKRRVLASEERKMDPRIQPEGGKSESLEIQNALASVAEGQVGSSPSASVSRKSLGNPHRKAKT